MQYKISMRKGEKDESASRSYSKPLQVRVTPEQYETFEQAAKADGRSLSNWARDRLEKAAQKEIQRPKRT